jgi:AraC family transcriptional regulator of adaptative response / DNA-3-methyladenine glycosylase II
VAGIESPLGVIATLSRDEMLARSRARDRALDGRVLVGVTSTGIYCLPSCPARKPRPENTVFFESEPEARRAGLRPCKRCRPDRFLRGHDPELDLAASLARRVREAPGAFGDAASLASAAGVGATKLASMLRAHFHTTPADILSEARVRFAAAELAHTSRRLVDVALDAGFESSSTFHENFRRLMAMTPAAWREVGESDGFVLALPADFRREEVLAQFGRDPAGATERVNGARAEKALVLGGTPLCVAFEFSKSRVRVRLSARPRPELLRAAHPLALRVLGLRGDPYAFERRARRAGFARLVSRRPGLRVPQTADAFEGLMWVVVGQQVNLAFASLCRARVIELCRLDAGGGMFAHPTARAVAELVYRARTGAQFSRS